MRSVCYWNAKLGYEEPPRLAKHTDEWSAGGIRNQREMTYSNVGLAVRLRRTLSYSQTIQLMDVTHQVKSRITHELQIVVVI